MAGIPDEHMTRLSEQLKGMRELTCYEASVLHSMNIEFSFVSGEYGAEGPRLGVYWFGLPPDNFIMRVNLNRYFV